MSWSLRRISKTVKFRIAVWYAALFAISAIAGLALLYFCLGRALYDAVDRQLKNSARELVYEYLTGKRFQKFDRELPLAAVKPGTLQRFRQKLPTLQPLVAFERNVSDDQFQILYGCADGKLYELRLGADNTVYSQLLDPANHLAALQKTFEDREVSEGRNNLVLRLYAADGRLLAHSLTSNLSESTGPLSRERYSTVSGPTADFRLLELPLFDGSRLLIGRNLQPTQTLMHQYLLICLVTFAGILLAGSLCGWFIASRFLCRVQRVSATARQIAAGDFSRRVPVGNDGTEIDELVHTFNRMTANTEKLFLELQSVTDDVAHDLRTPLTRIRGLAEITVSGRQELSAYREMAAIVAEECNQMLQIINTMLEITRMEANCDKLTKEEFDLNRLLARAGELFSASAEAKSIELHLHLPATPVPIVAEKLKIQRVFANLLDNALKFTAPGGSIDVELTTAGQAAVTRIRDNGCGIRPEDLSRVFERFFRSDPSRNCPGNGLGLALVRAIVQAHGGTIQADSKFGQGTEFTVFLPQK